MSMKMIQVGNATPCSMTLYRASLAIHIRRKGGLEVPPETSIALSGLRMIRRKVA